MHVGGDRGRRRVSRWSPLVVGAGGVGGEVGGNFSEPDLEPARARRWRGVARRR